MTGAAYTQMVSPGTVVSVFGANLAPSAATAPGVPLPTSLNGVFVTVNGMKAPLFYVSPSQINLQIPWELQSSIPGIATGTFQVVVTTPAGPSAPAPVSATSESPALFTQDASGCGAAAALNAAPDGTLSVNTPSNSAAPGDTIALFATGLGAALFPQVPADGAPPSVLTQFYYGGGVFLDGRDASQSFRGLAPGLVGVDQINAQIPLGIREGCAIPVAVYTDPFVSQTAAISIHSGRGPCVDPPVQSYGSVTLSKTISSGTSSDGEVDLLTADFPAAPGLPAPEVPAVLQPGAVQVLSTEIPPSRSCPFQGYQELSAGTIQVQPKGGNVAQASPQATTSGVTYQQTLPQSFVAPGQYAISASGGAVSLSGTLTVGSPIQIQTSLAKGTTIDVSKCSSFVLNWTGGDAGTLVSATFISETQNVSDAALAEADAAAGTIVFQPVCSPGVPGSLGVTGGPVRLVVEVGPYPSNLTAFAAAGTTGAVVGAWKYRYIFDGLALLQ